MRNLLLRDAVLSEERVHDRSRIELVLDFQLLYWKGTKRLPVKKAKQKTIRVVKEY